MKTRKNNECHASRTALTSKRQTPRSAAGRILHEVLDWSRVLLTALVISFGVSHTLIANAQVPTGSMETTIMKGSRIIVNRLAYVSADPQRGDIIAF